MTKPALALALALAAPAFAVQSAAPDPTPAIAAEADDPPVAMEAEVDDPSLEIAPPLPRGALTARRLRGIAPAVVGQLFAEAPASQIALAVLAAPRPGATGLARVPFFVEIDGPSLLDHARSATSRLEIYAYAVTERRAVAGHLAEVLALPVARRGEAIWEGGLKFHGELELAPGTYTLLVLVREYRSGAHGRVDQRLVVPDFTAAQPHLLPLLLPPPGSRDSWIPAFPWRDPADLDRAAAPGLPLSSPAARPVVAAGAMVEAVVGAFGLPPGPLTAEAQLVALPSGEQVGTSRAFELTRGDLEHGMETLSVQLAIPDAAPGTYGLRLSVSGPEGSATTEPLPTIVIEPNQREGELLWTDLRSLLAGPRPAPEVEADAPTRDRSGRRGSRRLIKKLAAEYAALLAGLDPESTQATRTGLFDLESGALGRRARDPFEALQQAELQVATQLATRDPESLLPILALHEEAYGQYRRRQLYTLLGHTRSVIEQLAELYATHGRGGRSQTLAAEALVSLAGYLQVADLPRGSRRLFHRALELDPSNHAALLGLACSYEKRAEYSQAVTHLERLAQTEGAPAESRLRLALNLARVGSAARAREVLASLATGDAPDWVRAVAIQELARSHVEAGQASQAIELLEGALGAGGSSDRSILLLAHLYDREHRPHEALRLVEQVEASPSSADSPRMRYDSWPLEADRDSRRALQLASRQRFASLATALEGVRPD